MLLLLPIAVVSDWPCYCCCPTNCITNSSILSTATQARLATNIAMEIGWTEGELLTVVAASTEDSLVLLTNMQKMLNMGEASSVVVERMFQSQGQGTEKKRRAAETKAPKASPPSVVSAGNVVKPPTAWLEKKSVGALTPTVDTAQERRAKMAAAAEARMKRSK